MFRLEVLLLCVAPLVGVAAMVVAPLTAPEMVRRTCQGTPDEVVLFDCVEVPNAAPLPVTPCAKSETSCECAISANVRVYERDEGDGEDKVFGSERVEGDQVVPGFTRHQSGAPVGSSRFGDLHCVTFDAGYTFTLVLDERGQRAYHAGFSRVRASPGLFSVCLLLLFVLAAVGVFLVTRRRQAEQAFGANGSKAGTGEWAGDTVRTAAGIANAKKRVTHGPRREGVVQFAPNIVEGPYRGGTTMPVLHVFSGTLAELRAFLDVQARQATRVLLTFLSLQWLTLSIAACVHFIYT